LAVEALPLERALPPVPGGAASAASGLGRLATMAQRRDALMRLRTAAACAVSCNQPKPENS
jgi:hypothetical protein